ncbi:Xaa-Pro peptidase family protein [Natronococcus sp. A-GB1]|uniref:M24 family metallopeptidase n=1 Tax=Natronococcus sp. A-GB1 TaxID=3037648 RepID=UPI00241EEA45|nr:Xaa-Pro peptidase family protein [Natronococcus sp. A-GB1]MDG5760245.1 Xaa-Pro peptidase family protein [Natronococcus sp. A-GB1]
MSRDRSSAEPNRDGKAAFERLADATAAAGADAFVHVGDRFDDNLRYLTRFDGPDRDYAFVHVAGRAVLCAPRLFAEQAEREFPETVAPAGESSASSAAGRALEVLDDRLASPLEDVRVLALPSIPAGATRSLADAVGEVVLEPIDLGRARKTSAERDRHAFVQRAAQQGMARAEAVLAAATPETTEDDGHGELRWRGDPLTTERLRREVNATLARSGVRDAGNTVIGAGETCADLHFTGEGRISPDETVLLDLSPRGPQGYYADLTRTFVVGDVGEWERRAYEAVGEAQDAAFDALRGGAGMRAADVHEAATRTLAEYGFESGDVDVGMYHGTGHGVGVSLHEAPSLSSEDPLEAGHVVTVEPGVYDPDRGGVRLEDLIVVTADGYENLTAYPCEIEPNPTRTETISDLSN